MDINSFIIGIKKGKQSGNGGSDFPVKEYFEKTAEEINLAGVKKIPQYAIYQQANLKRLYMPDVETFGSSAICQCPALEEITLPKSVISVTNLAIFNNIGLKTITFEGTPEKIESSAIMSCINLETINCPWPEGAVAGAPWGGNSAQINYNYTGG